MLLNCFQIYLVMQATFSQILRKYQKIVILASFMPQKTEQMKQQMLKQLTCKSSNSMIRIVFATIAIGNGVNTPSIRQVIHVGAARTLESHYQEIGRGGRDGKSTKAFLYFNGQDIAANKLGMTGEMKNFCLDKSEEADDIPWIM